MCKGLVSLIMDNPENVALFISKLGGYMMVIRYKSDQNQSNIFILLTIFRSPKNQNWRRKSKKKYLQLRFMMLSQLVLANV